MHPSHRFGDLLSRPLRSGVTVATANRGNGIKMLNMGELFRYSRIPAIDMARVDIDHRDPERVLLFVGDLVFARRSLTLEGAGRCSIVQEVSEPTTWESSIIRARVDPREGDARFYFYYFMSPAGRRSIQTIVEQVAAAGIRLSELARLKVPKPPLEEQTSIADILSALNDKIASNDKIATLADELVRSLYEAAGGTASDTMTIGSLAWSPRELVDPASVDPNTPYVGLEHLPRRCMWLSEASRASFASSAKTRFDRGDVLFGKLRPYFHKVASAPISGICSTDILVCRAKSPEMASLMLAAISSDLVVERCTAASEGTRMPRTSWTDLQAVEVPRLGTNEAYALSTRIGAAQEAVEAALSESATLATLRDTLLPQLMSGKLRIKDAEKRVEEVV